MQRVSRLGISLAVDEHTESARAGLQYVARFGFRVWRLHACVEPKSIGVPVIG
jgi:hypothetical protein